MKRKVIDPILTPPKHFRKLRYNGAKLVAHRNSVYKRNDGGKAKTPRQKLTINDFLRRSDNKLAKSRKLHKIDQPNSISTTKTSKGKKASIKSTLKLLLLLTLAIIIGVLVQTLAIGELALGIYTLVAIFRKIPSSKTFTLAFISLISLIILQLTQGSESYLTTSFAVYTYLLLAIGALSMSLEIRQKNKKYIS